MARLLSIGVGIVPVSRSSPGPEATRRSRPRRGRAWGVELLEGRIVLSTITVMNTNDSGPGSFRAAITQADMDTTQDTIGFAPAVTGTITLLSALPDLTGNTILSGPGASAMTVARSTASGTPGFGIFSVDKGAQVTISGLTITGGSTGVDGGGGIANEGTLTVTDSNFSGNTSVGGFGGGIGNDGTLTVINSTFSGNLAAAGGGIGNDGTLTVTDSNFSDNVGTDGIGGGIGSIGTLTVTNSTFSGNYGGFGGGIGNNGGPTTVTNSTFSANFTQNGGGIANGGTLTLTNSTLSGNFAKDGGGGIDNFDGSLTVTNSTLSGNSAGDGGGIDGSGFSTLTVSDSTLSGNSASGSGGGVYVSTSEVGLVVKVTAINSIFSNSVGGNLVIEPGGEFVSMGHNLFSDKPSVPLDPTDLTDTNPELGPLADNGGPTETMALLPGSPAIDAGVAVAGVTTDQRGVPRPQGKAPDIGAFELVTGAYVLLTPVTATELVGTSQSLTATVIDPNVRPIVDVPVTFQVTAGPNTGATGTTDPANGQTDANGQVTFTYSDTGGEGTDTIVATVTLPDGTKVSSPGATVLWTTFTVTNTNDSGPGSLRAAIALADGRPGRNTIDFSPSVTGTITLLSALPDLTGDTNLSGPGASALTVARSAAPGTPEFGIFTVDAGAQVTISGLTITGGQAVNFGGGIDNAGTLMVTDSTLSGNSAGGLGSVGFGGGIDNAGTLTVIDSTLSGNSGGGEIPGGAGFYATGTGGGIDNAGTLTVIDSTLSGNSGGAGGGGIESEGTLTVTDSTLSGNSAGGGTGGGIDNGGTLALTNSTLSGNRAGTGGGIDNGGTLTVTDSTLSGNTATGGFVEFSFFAGIGGGIANGGTLTVINSTLSGNTATGGFVGEFGSSQGGGIGNEGGTVTVINSTLSGNTSASGGGVFVPTPEFGRVGKVTAIDSIFANPVGGNLVIESGGEFVSLGHNLFSDTPAVSLAPTDLTNTDPLLAPLGDYGGPTQTMALLPGSPAIDAGVAVAGVTTDQRGVPRPQGTAPDIGAFESRGFVLALVSGDNQSTPAGSAFPTPLVVQVSSPFGEPIVGGHVVFSAPSSGPSLFPISNTATIGADGQAALTATANAFGGSYVVVAQVSASASVPFTLNNEGGLLPTVASVQRLGVHQQPTRLLLFFTMPLDPATAQDPGNYTLTTTGRRPSTIAIDAAIYDATTRSVTLFSHERLSLTRAYRLTVRGSGSGAVASASGVLLDGTFQGKPGTDFTTEVYGGGTPRWVGAAGPGLSNSPLGNDGPTAQAVDALFSRPIRAARSGREVHLVHGRVARVETAQGRRSPPRGHRG
jgi:hypothetical protein